MHGQVPATIPNCLSPCIHPLFITDQTLTFMWIMHIHTRRAAVTRTGFFPLKYQSRSCRKWDKHDCKNSHVVIISFLFTLPYINLRLKYVWFSCYPTDNPSFLTILKDFPVRQYSFRICPSRGHFYALFLNTARTRAWNQFARSPRPCWYLRQMWSAKAQESMCVCTISSGSRSLTKFKVDKKNLDIYVRCV